MISFLPIAILAQVFSTGREPHKCKQVCRFYNSPVLSGLGWKYCGKTKRPLLPLGKAPRSPKRSLLLGWLSRREIFELSLGHIQRLVEVQQRFVFDKFRWLLEGFQVWANIAFDQTSTSLLDETQTISWGPLTRKQIKFRAAGQMSISSCSEEYDADGEEEQEEKHGLELATEEEPTSGTEEECEEEQEEP